jgi:peptidoglycan/xylan/chitin deacetylase (PgdA/CDA1 family)
VTAPSFLASFDIEDWFHAENIRPWLATTDWDRLEGRVERNTHELLDLVGEAGARSTFFVLGWVARRYPALVRRIVDDGHELASHTDMHKKLWSLSRPVGGPDGARVLAGVARAGRGHSCARRAGAELLDQ